MKEDAGPSTSNEGEKTGDTSANETKEDPLVLFIFHLSFLWLYHQVHSCLAVEIVM